MTGDILLVAMIQMLLIAAVIGVIPAMVAHKKGRSVFGWWLFGFALAIVAIPAIFLVEDLNAKRCPQCAERVKKEAVVCRHCGYTFFVELTEPAHRLPRG